MIQARDDRGSNHHGSAETSGPMRVLNSVVLSMRGEGPG